MSIVVEIETARNEKQNVRYPAIFLALEKMNKAERGAVLTALADDAMSAQVLADILTRNGHNVRADSIRSLRRGDFKSVTIEDLKEKFS